jgi:hypothetical protein
VDRRNHRKIAGTVPFCTCLLALLNPILCSGKEKYGTWTFGLGGAGRAYLSAMLSVLGFLEIPTGRTPAETMKRMKKAIMLHIEGLREDNLPVPKPSTSVGYITVAS